MSRRQRIRRTRVWLGLFVCGLVVAGLTAFPLEYETRLVVHWLNGPGAWVTRDLPAMAAWLRRAHEGFAVTYAKYSFLAYGTDWLGFGHLMIAVAFIGPLRDPIRNKWVIQFGMIACVLVIPLALIAGPLRGIPSFWTPIDCSFGVLGIIPLAFAYRHVRALEREAVALGRDAVGIDGRRPGRLVGDPEGDTGV